MIARGVHMPDAQSTVADVIESHRDRIVAEATALLDAHVASSRALHPDDRSRTATTICVAFEHFLRGAPFPMLRDVLKGLADKRRAEGFTFKDLLLAPGIYTHAMRRGAGQALSEAQVRVVEDAMLRVAAHWNDAILALARAPESDGEERTSAPPPDPRADFEDTAPKPGRRR